MKIFFNKQTLFATHTYNNQSNILIFSNFSKKAHDYVYGIPPNYWKQLLVKTLNTFGGLSCTYKSF